MNLKFWEKEEEIQEEPKPLKVGSFLFASKENQLHVMSIERIEKQDEGYTVVKFRDGVSDSYRGSYSDHRYNITYDQHEDFVDKISDEIDCVVMAGGDSA